MKVSAVAEDKRVVEAPALVFDSQAEVLAAFKRGDLDRDCVIVVRGQGPRANGMPELHKLMPLHGRAAGSRLQGRARRPTGACRARAAKCWRRSTSRRKRPKAGRWRKCAMAMCCASMRENGVLDVISPADWRDRAPAQLDLAGNARGVWPRAVLALPRQRLLGRARRLARFRTTIRSSRRARLLAAGVFERFVARRGAKPSPTEISISRLTPPPSGTVRCSTVRNTVKSRGDERQIVRRQVHDEHARRLLRGASGRWTSAELRASPCNSHIRTGGSGAPARRASRQ